MVRDGHLVRVCAFDGSVSTDARTSSHHSGQMCSAGSRIFVQEGIYDKFVEAFTAASQAVKAGDLFDPTTTHTPVVSQLQFDVSPSIC